MDRTDVSRLPRTLADYRPILEYLASSAVSIEDRDAFFKLCAERDFWFFCRYCTDARNFYCEFEDCEHYAKPIFEHPYIFEFCRDVQAFPDGWLRLQPRGHLKTTIVTVLQTLWDFTDRPDETVAIITWTVDQIGEGFIEGLQKQMEPIEVPPSRFSPSDVPVISNEILAYHWPNVFWADPATEAPKAGKAWRRGELDIAGHGGGGSREHSIMVFGLTALRTSKHFGKIIFDDIVNDVSSLTPDACAECTEKFGKTTGLMHPTKPTKLRGVGTFWAVQDTYHHIIDQGILKLREGWLDCYAADGETSIFHPGSTQFILACRKGMTDALFAANMRNRCLDEDSIWQLDPDWLRHSYYDCSPEEAAKGANLYAFVDPAKLKRGGATRRKDYLAIVVMALRPDGRRYVVEMIRDKVEVGPMAELVFDIDDYWRRQGNPIRAWWWESNGASLDVEFWRLMADKRKNYGINFRQFSSNEQKDIRISRLKYPFSEGLIRLPRQNGALMRMTDGAIRDMVSVFVQEEYTRWRPSSGGNWRPSSGARNEDLLDAMSQSEDPKVQLTLEYPVATGEKSWAAISEERSLERQRRFRGNHGPNGRSPWAC